MSEIEDKDEVIFEYKMDNTIYIDKPEKPYRKDLMDYEFNIFIARTQKYYAKALFASLFGIPLMCLGVPLGIASGLSYHETQKRMGLMGEVFARDKSYLEVEMSKRGKFMTEDQLFNGIKQLQNH